MGTGRTLNKKPATRPVKSAGERRRRDAVQRKRLMEVVHELRDSGECAAVDGGLKKCGE